MPGALQCLANISIVFFHTGIRSHSLPVANQTAFSDKLIDLARISPESTLVICHGGGLALFAFLGWIMLLLPYFFGSRVYHGSFLSWLALFAGAAGTVFLISISVVALVELITLASVQILKPDVGNAKGGAAARRD